MKTYRIEEHEDYTVFVRSNHKVFDYTKINVILLESYASTIFIADFDKQVITFFRHWLYSATTTKHRNNTLSEYGFYDLTGSSENIRKAIDVGHVFIGKQKWTVKYNNDTRTGLLSIK